MDRVCTVQALEVIFDLLDRHYQYPYLYTHNSRTRVHIGLHSSCLGMACSRAGTNLNCQSRVYLTSSRFRLVPKESSSSLRSNLKLQTHEVRNLPFPIAQGPRFPRLAKSRATGNDVPVWKYDRARAATTAPVDTLAQSMNNSLPPQRSGDRNSTLTCDTSGPRLTFYLTSDIHTSTAKSAGPICQNKKNSRLARG